MVFSQSKVLFTVPVECFNAPALLVQIYKVVATHVNVAAYKEVFYEKIEEYALNPDILETIRNVGYRLSED